MISRTAGPAPASYLVFESDDGGEVAFTWLKRDELRITIPDVADIARSERHVPGLSITYAVPQTLLQEIDYDLSARARERNAPYMQHLDPADRKSEEKAAADYRRYLIRFRTWVRDYSKPD